MKVLLIIPPNSQKERYGKFSGIGTLYPPLGLAYLAAVAEKTAEIRVLDSEAMDYTLQDIRKLSQEFMPDVVGMQVYCTTINRCYKVAAIIKKISRDIKIVLGGAQVTLEPKKTISNENIDFGVYGEGEIVFSNLLNAIKNKKSISKIRGVVWKSKNKVVINKPQELVKNLDSLPMPARHLFPMEKYHSSANLRGKRTLNIITSRGCPYMCAYCAGSLIFGKTHRYHGTERVIEELRELKEKYNADDIQFFDETFTANRQRVMELCDKIIERKLNIEWSCFTRVNLVDRELLKKMKQAGCYQIFYGLESGSQRLLNLIRKGITLEQSRKAMKMTHESGIETWVSFMIGLPSETREESEQTIKFALETDPTFVQFPITMPFPGTELYDLAKKYGRIITTNWDDYTAWDKVVFVSNGRTAADVKDTVRKAYRKFYLRPRYIIRRAKNIFHLPLSKILNLFISAIHAFLR
ncbi:MAG: radical SAM protein [Nanoarchaeota archaeon]|nr:radical SAM protein [Nanoarchaeota archaeon]